MCDFILKRNIPQSKIPKLVYKRVQKVGPNNYISPVMGEPIPFDRWVKAPDLKKKFNRKSFGWQSLVKFIKRKYPKKGWANSSAYTSKHVGKWGVFKYKKDAIAADLTSNFENPKTFKIFPTVIVKCEIKGSVDEGSYNGFPTYLASHLKIVAEVGKAS